MFSLATGTGAGSGTGALGSRMGESGGAREGDGDGLLDSRVGCGWGAGGAGPPPPAPLDPGVAACCGCGGRRDGDAVAVAGGGDGGCGAGRDSRLDSCGRTAGRGAGAGAGGGAVQYGNQYRCAGGCWSSSAMLPGARCPGGAGRSALVRRCSRERGDLGWLQTTERRVANCNAGRSAFIAGEGFTGRKCIRITQNRKLLRHPNPKWIVII